MSTQIPVAPGVFTVGPEPRLLGSRCVDCGNHTFPAQAGCPRCTGDHMEPVELGTEGTLWTWTIQGFPPKAPPYVGPTDDRFRPFGVGYVELPGQLKVETRLTVADPDRLRIGMPMRLVLDVLDIDADGNEIVTYAFAPTQEDQP